MESEDYVDFNKIREYIKIKDVNLFAAYLKEIFKDLASKPEKSKKKGISKITFLDYVKLPIFIAEKLFSTWDTDKDNYLSSAEFVEGMCKLYMGDFEQTADVLFNIFDFNKDGVIERGDVKILLSFLPLKTDKSKFEYKFQMQSLEEIDEILNHTFQRGKDSLVLEEFREVIEFNKSDVYLQLLCFFYQKKPFKDENINRIKELRRSSMPNLTEKVFLSPQIQRRLPSPNRKSILSPADSFLKITLNSLNELKDVERVGKRKLTFVDEDNTPQVSGIKGMIRMPNEKISESSEQTEDINTLLKNSKNVFNSPSKYLKHGGNISPTEFNLEDNLVKLDELSLDEDSHEDWIYKLSESSKVKKYWLALIGKDIYYYKSEKKEELAGMHNLSGCFVKENGEKMVNGKKMYTFSLIFPGKARSYYCYEKEAAMKWSENIKKAIGYSSFFDHYEMLDDIGEGKFGLVKLGVHKKTKERVAIKIIKKESMKHNEDVELVKSEIEIMKLCKHQNVVKLLDHFENAEYIFIVMEYLPGGNLGDYFSKMKFRFTEERAAHIMHQLASGIKYLHQYGVLHRDLKPDNILLSESSDNGVVKILDFGLSKIVGPKERVADGFGTLSFVAPEVLVRQPYGKQVDIWSLGIILYYMLSGLLPFDDENDNEEVIAKMTVFVDVEFPRKVWAKRSSEVIDLIRHCLIKDQRDRITIDEFLNHPWILKHNS